MKQEDSKLTLSKQQLFEFLLRKEMCFEEIEKEFSDMWSYDDFNTETAERMLDISFNLYQDGTEDTEDKLMDKRNEFVSEFLEYVKCEVVRKWARNTGMVTYSEARAEADERVRKYGIEEYNRGFEAAVDTWETRFKEMSAYEFSAWKFNLGSKDKIDEKIMNNTENSIFYDKDK